MGGGFVVGGECGDVVVALRRESGAGVDDVDSRGGGVGGCEADVDGGNHNVRDEVGIDEVPSLEIVERIYPGDSDGSVLDGKDRTLFIVGRLRIKELRVPVLTGPGALAFGAEEGRGLSIG